MEGVPVGETQEPHGIEQGGLPNDRSRAVRFDLEDEPRSTREPHLGGEAEQAPWLDGLHTPEIDRVANDQVARIAATAAEADPADQQVEESTQAPQRVRGVPARGSAEPRDRLEREWRRRGDPDRP